MRRASTRSTFAILTVLLAVAGVVDVLAQAEGTLKGVVLDRETGEPIPLVNIYVRATSLGTTTDSSGAFTLSLPAAKKMIVSFSHVAYWKETYEVELEEGENVDLTVELESGTIELGGITITARRLPEDIWARVVTEKDIEERGFRSMTDILRWFAPSAMYSGSWHLRTSIYFPGGRNLKLIWNGMEIDPADVDIIDPYTVEQVLIWRGMDAPIRYVRFATLRFPRYVIDIRTKF